MGVGGEGEFHIVVAVFWGRQSVEAGCCNLD